MPPIKIPNIRAWREAVDHINNERNRLVIEVGYLLAARECEICKRVNPYNLKEDSTHKSFGYGQFLETERDVFRSPDGNMFNVFLLSSAVAKKRSKKVGEGEPEVEYKIVALPESPRYEPWTVDVMEWAARNKRIVMSKKTGKQDWMLDPSFNLTPRTINTIVGKFIAESFGIDDMSSIKNILRHIRLTHLRRAYRFDPFDLSLYSGQSLKTSFEKFGQSVSTSLEPYLDLPWDTYFPKLLKPIQEVIAESSYAEPAPAMVEQI